jgi:hypothetical protein
MTALFLSIADIRGTHLEDVKEGPKTLYNISLVFGYDYDSMCYFLKLENLHKNYERYTSIEEKDFKKIQSILIKRIPLAYECNEYNVSNYCMAIKCENDGTLLIRYTDQNEPSDEIKLELSEEQYNDLLDKLNILEANIHN